MELKIENLGMLGICFVLALSVFLGTASAQVCERFQTLPLDQRSLALASGDRSDAQCSAFLLKNLGKAHYAPRTRAMLKYLDFEWQQPNAPPKQMLQPWDVDKLPAFQALYAIGEKSASALIEFLGSRDLLQLERNRAVLLLLGVLAPRGADLPKAIKALVRASRDATDPVVAGRLRQAVTTAAAVCVLPACQAALLESPSQ
jgi:hypothetical protein